MPTTSSIRNALCSAFLPFAISALASCGGAAAPPTGVPSGSAALSSSAAPSATLPKAVSETLSTDETRATPAGTTFTAPAGWTLLLDPAYAQLSPPEGNLHVTFVDTTATTSDEAVKMGWALVAPEFNRALKIALTSPGREGWSERRTYEYETSPDEKREVFARALKHGDTWTVVLIDADAATYEKHVAQMILVRDTTHPAGFVRESFAGKKANTLDAVRLKALTDFVEHARDIAGVPGVGLALVQGGKPVFVGGFGVRELGKPEKVDGDTAFMIASNTKALTTLLLAEEVDQGKFTWETPAKALYPDFKLGDAATTDLVEVKHLVCACTGLPRQDYEWIFEFKRATPKSELGLLGTFQPTSKFGEAYQYSNLLAAAAGFIGGHVAYPKKELGAAYDGAMQARVFGPLAMTSTTFDHARALRGNHATPHADDIDGKPTVASMDINYSVVPLRPAGGAWSSARDLAKYVQLELDKGVLPDGTRLVSEKNLLARRERQVSVGEHEIYGMGLKVRTQWGVTVVHHGGGMEGFLSDMFWLPDYGVGGVLLTSAENGGELIKPLERRLLEVLFDGNLEAADDLQASVASTKAEEAAERKRLSVPADAAVVAKLAAHYRNAALGDLFVRRAGAAVTLDTGEWKTALATRKNDDGTVSLVMITPGIEPWSLVVSETGGHRTLLLRDMQHEYVFDEVK